MSLILEALRKSEAERRRGSAPDVAMELPPAVAAGARATPAWLAPLALSAGIVVLLAAWWWSQRDAVAAADTDSDSDTMANVAPLEPVADVAAPPVVVSRPAPAAVATTTATPPQPTPPPVAAAAPVATIAEPAPISAQPSLPPPAPVATTPDIDATSLPPVRLSMHMWDTVPGKRFVILDGQRMGEGDRNGELTVVAIEPDGVVVERAGQRARVPLP